MVDILPLLALLLAAMGVAAVTSRTRVPYTVALVLFGLAVGLVSERVALPGVDASVHSLLAPSVFFTLLLPPIVFEAALHVDAHRLRARAGLVLFLVFVGVIFTTVFTGVVFAAFTALPLAVALLLAAILSPTDPIAVVDLFRRLRVPGELSTIVESEALLNDAVGIIVFVVLLGIVGGEIATPGGVALRFLWLVAGGAAIGGLTAGLVYALHRWLEDPIAGTALSLVAAYGAYLVATALGASGILATAIAGIALGTWVLPNAPAGSPDPLGAFWSVAVYVANSLVFLAMGLAFGLTGLLDYLPEIALVFVLLTLSRAIFVYLHRPLARALGGSASGLPGEWYPLVTLAGVRGAIPVVLALSLVIAPATMPEGTVRTVVATVLGVVLVSLLVNNLLAEWYTERRFGTPPAAAGP